MFSDSVLTVPNGGIFLDRIFFQLEKADTKLLTADCHMPNCKEGINGHVILTPWANACCEFLNRPFLEASHDSVITDFVYFLYM